MSNFDKCKCPRCKQPTRKSLLYKGMCPGCTVEINGELSERQKAHIQVLKVRMLS